MAILLLELAKLKAAEPLYYVAAYIQSHFINLILIALTRMCSK